MEKTMKLVINMSWGGFSLPAGFCKKYSLEHCYDPSIKRNDVRLVSYVESGADDIGDLGVVEVPDDATDYRITEYDGNESVIYVLDGKMYDAY